MVAEGGGGRVGGHARPGQVDGDGGRVGQRQSAHVGVLGHDPVPNSATVAMANGAVESFVLAAAIGIAPRRINAVSPTIFTESVADYGDFFPGVEPVGLDRVTGAYVRSVEGGRTGQVYVLD